MLLFTRISGPDGSQKSSQVSQKKSLKIDRRILKTYKKLKTNLNSKILKPNRGSLHTIGQTYRFVFYMIHLMLD